MFSVEVQCENSVARIFSKDDAFPIYGKYLLRSGNVEEFIYTKNLEIESVLQKSNACIIYYTLNRKYEHRYVIYVRPLQVHK